MVATLSNRKLLRIVVAIVSTVLYFLNAQSSSNSGFQLAKYESLGFFDDLPSAHWKLLKQKVADMSPNYNAWYLPHPGKAASWDKRNEEPGYFYQNHYEPEFVCLHERRIGKLGDGGKWICDPHRITKQDNCLVYSIGSNNDFSFEQAILDHIGPHCEIHTVSPLIICRQKSNAMCTQTKKVY
jgi:hypothetical protein